MANRKCDLCVPCAEQMKEGYILRKVGGGVANKVTCGLCGRRRYGSSYELEKKKQTPALDV